MSEFDQLQSEKLVQVHRARNEWEANLIAGYLRDNGVEATLEVKTPRARAGARAGYWHPDGTSGVFVLQHDEQRARELAQEFLNASSDEKILEELASHKPPLTKERFAELRAALREERRTFQFLCWLGVVFLGAALLLRYGIIGLLGFRWAVLAVIMLAALLVGNWLRERL